MSIKKTRKNISSAYYFDVLQTKRNRNVKMMNFLLPVTLTTNLATNIILPLVAIQLYSPLSEARTLFIDNWETTEPLATLNASSIDFSVISLILIRSSFWWRIRMPSFCHSRSMVLSLTGGAQIWLNLLAVL